MISLLKRSNLWMLMIICNMLFSACREHPKSPVQSDYGAAYNHIRDNLGLKSILSDWEASDTIKYQDKSLRILYANPNIDTTLNEFKAYYAGKTLEIKNDTLYFESDDYFLVKFLLDGQRVVKEILNYMYYYYPANNSNIPPRMYNSYLINPHPELDSLPEFTYTEWIDAGTRYDSDGRSIPMTRAEADSILATWGMKYP